jgi:GTP-binding protein
MFIDEVKIHLKSGRGGNGCVSFRREKFIPEGGPDGGNGGRGGSVIFVSNGHLNTLLHFRYKQHFVAQNGRGGSGQNKAGKAGEHLVIEVPIGTQIFHSETNELIFDFVKEFEEYEILEGGKGGAGNHCFKSSKNRSPETAIEGEAGQEISVWLKLKLISDVGLIGLPNAGKSTFLARVTSAKPKIADYPFTTLTPNLGVVFLDEKEFIIADIPGLIEGAHEGHGLGDKFLKHIERCSILVHLIDITSEHPVEDYHSIRHELDSYSSLLAEKQEIIVLTKADALSDEEIAEKKEFLEQDITKEIYVVSSHSGKNLVDLIRLIMVKVQSLSQ